MKCPHCQTGIHSGYTSAPVFSVESLKGADGSVIAPMIFGYPSYLRCPECFGLIVVLQITTGLGGDPTQKIEKLMVYPKSISRPVPPEVPDPYRQDFVEAAEALSYSEKASGALSRRCLQSILRDKAGVTHSNLHNEINEVMATSVRYRRWSARPARVWQFCCTPT